MRYRPRRYVLYGGWHHFLYESQFSGKVGSLRGCSPAPGRATLIG